LSRPIVPDVITDEPPSPVNSLYLDTTSPRHRHVERTNTMTTHLTRTYATQYSPVMPWH